MSNQVLYEILHNFLIFYIRIYILNRSSIYRINNEMHSDQKYPREINDIRLNMIYNNYQVVFMLNELSSVQHQFRF